jgi:hypothetical protein
MSFVPVSHFASFLPALPNGKNHIDPTMPGIGDLQDKNNTTFSSAC